MIDGLTAWYDANKRELPWREPQPSAYHVWLSEIMLQQTRVEAVKGYYGRFLEAAPTIAALARLDDDRLLKLWEGLGYYSRARNLKRTAQILMREHGGVLPRDPAELIKLPGIGLYTAGAVASIAYGVPAPAVDGNVLRVLARAEGDFSNIALEQTKKAVAARLLSAMPKHAPGAFNQALMELGAVVCLPNGAPRCGQCPWQNSCAALREGLIGQLPVKSAKKPRAVIERRLFILRCGERLALRRRPEHGLLAGLWELPEAFALPGDLVVSRESAGSAVHIFTHREWHMTAERVVLSGRIEGFSWITQEELEREFALPSAFSGFRAALFA
jgi:A/G-specific adenine glycosylase